MRFTDIFKLALRMFRARTMRTLLTIFGMGLGIAAILFFVSLGYGLQKTVLEKITTVDALVTLDVTNDQGNQVFLTEENLRELSRLPGVVEVSPAAQFSGQVKYAAVTLDVDATATTGSFLRLNGTKPLTGTLLNDDQPNGLIVTQGLARIFNLEAEQIVGQTVTLTLFASEESAAKKREQIGLTAPKDYTVLGVIEGEDNLAFFHSDMLAGVDFGNYNQAKIKCQTAEVMAVVRNQILEKGFGVSSLSETIDQANKVFRVIQLTLMFFGIIALVVSAIGMFNTMTIALLERTEEIGIMKSIGASPFSISLMFVLESALMGFLGSLGGVLLSYLTGEGFNWGINLIARRFGGQAVDLFESPLWFVGAIIVFGAFVGFLTGIFPARQASRINPLDALRYK